MSNSIRLEQEKILATSFLLFEVTEVTVTFDGSGDNGCIENISVNFKDSNKNPNNLLITFPVIRSTNNFDEEKQTWVHATHFEEKEISLYEAIEEHVYSRLNESGVDWINNEGGFGQWVWTPKDGLHFEINVRRTDYSTEFEDHGSLGVYDRYIESDDEEEIV